MKIQLLLMACLSLSIGVRAQTDSLLHDPLPTTKEEFTASGGLEAWVTGQLSQKG